MAVKNQPAAGASGGRDPLPAVIHVPRFLNHEQGELHVLLNNLRDPLCTQLYMLIEAFCVFDTGEFLGSYALLIELCTPPRPERGRRRPGPSMRVIRRAVADLESAGLLRRGSSNEEHGQLRLFVQKLASKPAPKTKAVRVSGRVREPESSIPTRVAAAMAH